MKLGLIGNPIKHSLSPWIHSRLLELAGIEGQYQLYEMQPGSFQQQIELLRNEQLDGFNVTVPFKQKIMPELDDIDGQAKKLGAVNTVKNHDGRWLGYNTDGKGFVNSLRAKYGTLLHPDTKVLLLGAGGAAKGIFFTLLNEGVRQIDVANRTTERAEAIVNASEAAVSSHSLTLKEAEGRIAEYHLIIQTTTVGMNPRSDESIISLKNMKEGAVVSDIVYQPLETAFLKDAISNGGRIHQGHEMLLYQAVYAFKIWTGKSIDETKLLMELEAQLKGE
ncbi:shikimate dehydrogenase [Thalassobacillus pellis]|uniref:shikimate dehydrogenase n=1 Tax=Thalassobacillus pellis TaxID=748008 RepID=UPI00196181CB|nr:shikimate dehydrogenase [Thalassobacillus pellis]MBM7554693.1 shikimate dehydrogenase [Thalassobacillus pellis]